MLAILLPPAAGGRETHTSLAESRRSLLFGRKGILRHFASVSPGGGCHWMRTFWNIAANGNCRVPEGRKAKKAGALQHPHCAAPDTTRRLNPLVRPTLRLDSASLDRTGAGVSKAAPMGGETLEENPP